MSTAPRPQTSPSISSPPKGSCAQPSAVSAGTRSVWPINASDGAPRSVPSMRATSDARPATGSYQSMSRPGPSIASRNTDAFADSVPTDTPSTKLLTQRLRISTPSRSAISRPRTDSATAAPSDSRHALLSPLEAAKASTEPEHPRARRTVPDQPNHGVPILQFCGEVGGAALREDDWRLRLWSTIITVARPTAHSRDTAGIADSLVSCQARAACRQC